VRRATQRPDLRLVPCRCLGCGLEFTERKPLAAGAAGAAPARCPGCGSDALHWLEWFVVQTHRGAEPLVERKLEAQGFETFCPRYRRVVNRARRLVTVVRAFLPSYLFVGLARGQGLYTVNKTQGVATVVHNNGRAERLPESVVTEWRKRMGESGIIDVPAAGGPRREKYESGQEVEVVEGCFVGARAIVEVDSGQTIDVWLDAFNGRVKASFYPEALSPVVRRLPG